MSTDRNLKNDVSDVFHNRNSLQNCEHKQLKRCLGIRVGFPHQNQGAGGIVCEIESEYISVNTTSCVSFPLVGSINKKAINLHDSMIKKIDDVLDELNLHKNRLLQDKKALESKSINLDAIVEDRLKS